MRNVALAIVATCACCVAGAGDFRPGTPETIDPPRTHAPQPPDPAVPFGRAYAAAHSPRIVLFWNVRLTDRTSDERIAQETDTTSARSAINQLKKTTQGDAQSAELLDGERKSEVRRVKEKREVVLDDAHVGTTLSARNSAMLERAFTSEMRRGGISFVDRSLAMRKAAAQKHRGGGDARLIETDAITDKADWLMQVVMVPDADAVLGWGFDVTLRDVASGVEVASLYSQARPKGLEGQPVWVANDRGFERRVPKRAPTVADVAHQLANDVMDQVAAALDARRGR